MREIWKAYIDNISEADAKKLLTILFADDFQLGPDSNYGFNNGFPEYENEECTEGFYCRHSGEMLLEKK